MDTPKISVIVPVYNVEEFLPRCLDSLVNQTLENIEILVVNDGSKDGSKAIAEEYARRFPEKVKLLDKENGGLSDARNFGIERARGEYLAFVDSDDYVELDYCEQLTQTADATGADVVCCTYSNIYKSKVVKNHYKEAAFGQSVLESPVILRYSNSFAWNKIYRREFWMRHGFRFPVGHWFEDSYLVYNVLLAANRVEFVNKALYHYVRYREESITNRVDPRLFDILKSCENIVAYYKEHGVFNVMRPELEYICLRHLTARLPQFKKSSDKAMGRDFIRRMIEFLNREFPEWKKNSYVRAGKNAAMDTKLHRLMLRHKTFMLLYIRLPEWVYDLYGRWRTAFRNLKNKLKGKHGLTEAEKEIKRFYIRKNGLEVLHEVQTVLNDLGIRSFADFGTCLGLVREGKLLAHDLDLDIGVIADDFERRKIRSELERRGYRVWREYVHNGSTVEESYHYRRVKIDLNYYEMSDEYAKTWLFYTKPGYRYEKNFHRHVVEMTYSPIREFRTEEFEGLPVVLPANAEKLMEEKYGPNWRTPDTDWIYWQSPAAKKLDEIGFFRVFVYRGL